MLLLILPPAATRSDSWQIPNILELNAADKNHTALFQGFRTSMLSLFKPVIERIAAHAVRSFPPAKSLLLILQ